MSLRILHVKTWISAHRTRVIIAAAAIIVLGAGLTTYFVLSQPLPKPSTKKIAVKPRPQPVYYSPLTGEKVASESDRSKAVTAIIIENSPDARPQSGLKQAEIVYEAVAEGGITRFLVVYQQHKPGLIGPVRSVRPYYLDWARPYDASIAHVGGSAAALAMVRDGSWRDIDQFFNGGSYYRATDRYAPHNVYTTFERLDALNNSKGFTSSAPKEMERVDGRPSTDINAALINVHISSATYDSSYTYDSATNLYTRSQAGAVHSDREEGTITPSVVIVLNVNESTVFQDTNRQEIQTTGSGVATIFQNGIVTQGTWNKPTQTEQLSFTDGAGAPIKLVRGQTWITAIPNGRGNVSWQ